MESKQYKLGALVAILGAVLGAVGSLILFVRWYDPVMTAEILAGRPDEKIIVQYIFPALNDLSILAGILWAVAAYGFFRRRTWSWSIAVIANVLALQGSFFPVIPPVTRDLPPYSALIFIPNIILYFVLLLAVRKVDWPIIVVGLFSGMAMVLSFMNGVASTDKILVTDKAIFVAVQRLNWIAALGWLTFTVGWLLVRAEWVHLVGLGAGLLEVVAGLPLGLQNALETGRFSMFLPAPLLSLALIILLLLPWRQKLSPALKTATN